jgi:hypothetical protein
MIAEDIRGALHRKPFRSFTIDLADGLTLPVLHPDNLLIASDSVIVVVWNPERTRSTTHIVDMVQVTRVSYAEAA